MVGMDRVAAPGGGGPGPDYGEYGMGAPPPVPGARPKVDPEALGEVDPTVYPEPKDATHKIRGRSDILEMLCGSVDQELLTVKTFYFFFYSAFGSLFPLMGVYFKQMGMNPGQCGLLIGSRPFVEFLSAPFWGSLADRWQRGKTMLLASLGAWILFTVPLGFIQPPAVSCMEYSNHTWRLSGTHVDDGGPLPLEKRSVPPNAGGDGRVLLVPVAEEALRAELWGEADGGGGGGGGFGGGKLRTRERRSLRQDLAAGLSPVGVGYASNYDEAQHATFVRPNFSFMVFRTQDIEKAFFLLLLLVIIGEFFSAPAITLADSAVITLLGEDADRYGHQRMFGSLGWGLAMFFVGIALDHSTAFPGHPCGPGAHEKNYTICFATFSVLMGAALITATQIQFRYDVPGPEELAAVAAPPPDPEKTREDALQAQLAQQLDLPQLAPPAPGPADAHAPAPLVGKTKMFAQTTREMPEWVTVMKQFANLKCGSFLFVAWFMGFGIGLIFTFLFWHLQDYGGSPTLFGVASVINHISEIFAYFFSFRLIRQMGHVKVLCLGLVGNVLRFLYISYLKNPWWVLPFEFMQGITHAAVWAACCSYIAHNTPQQLRSSAQGVLQGIHHGLGRGCGAVIGGMFVNYFGTTATFRGYGVCCLLVLGAFVFINFYRRDTGFVSELPATEDPHQVAEETAHLAPHGVPSNPIPRALSSTRLHELAGDNGGYGATAYQTADGSLGVPNQGGTTNPFLQNGGGGGYSYRADAPESEEVICRNFQRYNAPLAREPECKETEGGPPAFTRLQAQQPMSTAHAAYDW